jgi:hypothetical protein
LPRHDRSDDRGWTLAWLVPLLPPLVWFLYLLVSYALVPRACTTGTSVRLYVAALIALLAAASAGGLAWRLWRDTGQEWPDEAGGVIPRSRFLAGLAVLSSGLFFMVVLAQGVPTVILSPCQP